MDNEFKDLEDALRELEPKEASHGARWNLAQRLADLETAEEERSRRPNLILISSVAASILVVLVIWFVVSHSNRGGNERIVDTPPKPQGVKEDVAEVDKPVVKDENGGMELVGDEDEYPSSIPFEIKRHLTAEEDLGIVRIPDQPPMRKVRREYVSELIVKDPKTGKTYRVQKPESETILLRLEDD